MSNIFAGWTPEMVKAHNARVAGERTPVMSKLIADALKAKGCVPITAKVKQEKTILPTKKKPLMNKLETDFYAELKRRGHKFILCQALTLQLPDNIRYRPDFVVIHWNFVDPSIQMIAYETKGPHRFAERGVMKLRLAAATYPWLEFRLVRRVDGHFQERVVNSNLPE